MTEHEKRAFQLALLEKRYYKLKNPRTPRRLSYPDGPTGDHVLDTIWRDKHLYVAGVAGVSVGLAIIAYIPLLIIAYVPLVLGAVYVWRIIDTTIPASEVERRTLEWCKNAELSPLPSSWEEEDEDRAIPKRCRCGCPNEATFTMMQSYVNYCVDCGGEV